MINRPTKMTKAERARALAIVKEMGGLETPPGGWPSEGGEYGKPSHVAPAHHP